MRKVSSIIILILCQSYGASNQRQLYDWMICVGGYKFENEDKVERKGIEISFLPEPYFGFVANVDFDGNSPTRNLGIEIISNALIIKLIEESSLRNNSFLYLFRLMMLIPGFEIGGSLDKNDEIGLHTSLFINLVVVHPYVDYNIYKNRVDRKLGVKWKIGFGPWFIKALQ